jgi:hypothetical protein
MEQESSRQIAHNEALFRKVNERLESGRWPGEEGAAIAFRCECGELGCSRMIELGVPAYERVRADSRRFLIAPDHDIPDVETIVERHPHYVVVQKRGEAGLLAERTDPRG